MHYLCLYHMALRLGLSNIKPMKFFKINSRPKMHRISPRIKNKPEIARDYRNSIKKQGGRGFGGLKVKYQRNSYAMKCTDTDMMEAEAAAPPQSVASNSDPNNVVRNLLSMARQLVDQDKPSQALQAVVMAMKLQGGNEAVSQALNRARELYLNKVQASAAAAELASLFAECAIAEAIPSQHETLFHNSNGHSTEPVGRGTSILAETGRSQIVLDASSDGSSFVCLQCGGLVSSHRREEHFAFWCCKI